MISTDMRTYNYFTLGDDNGYGQPTISQEPQGTIKMAINMSSQSVQDNINFTDCNYVGLTMAKLDDSYVIQYGNEKLKVQYINPRGRYTLVYLKMI